MQANSQFEGEDAGAQLDALCNEQIESVLVDDSQLDSQFQEASYNGQTPVQDFSTPDRFNELNSHIQEQPTPVFGSSNLSTYKRIDQVGDGTYGVVYRAQHTETGDIVALKKIKLDVSSIQIILLGAIRRDSFHCYQRDLPLMRSSTHECRQVRASLTFRLLDVVSTDTKLHLIFEFLDRDLKKYMDELKYEKEDLKSNKRELRRGPPNQLAMAQLDEQIKRKTERDAFNNKSIIFQILQGIAVCHGRRILHRDIKPQNILLDTAGHVKIADFGLARAFQVPIRPYTHEVVTLWYRAPEILYGSAEYSTPVDLWSVGCIMAELFIGHPIFRGDSEIGMIFKITEILGKPSDEDWPGFSELPYVKKSYPNFPGKNLKDLVPDLSDEGIDLLKRLFTYDPTKRITAKAALKHPYFDELKEAQGF